MRQLITLIFLCSISLSSASVFADSYSAKAKSDSKRLQDTDTKNDKKED